MVHRVIGSLISPAAKRESGLRRQLHTNSPKGYRIAMFSLVGQTGLESMWIEETQTILARGRSSSSFIPRLGGGEGAGRRRREKRRAVHYSSALDEGRGR